MQFSYVSSIQYTVDRRTVV